MKKKRRKEKLLCPGEFFTFLVSAFLLFGFFVLEYSANLFSPPIGTVQVWKCALLLAVCFSAYRGGFLLKRRTGKNPFHNPIDNSSP